MLKINLADPRASLAEYERLSRALVDDLEQKLEEAREELAKANERINEQQLGIMRHFRDEHLAGDGPKIDRWKRRLAAVEAAGWKLLSVRDLDMERTGRQPSSIKDWATDLPWSELRDALRAAEGK